MFFLFTGNHGARHLLIVVLGKAPCVKSVGFGKADAEAEAKANVAVKKQFL